VKDGIADLFLVFRNPDESYRFWMTERLHTSC
jgi:hypothetical protein